MCNNKLTKEQGNITPCTGQGGLVDGPRPCGGCGSAGRLRRPQEGEGRETGSPQGWGLLPAGTWQDWGDLPTPVQRRLWVRVLPGSGRYVGPPCVRQERLWALPAPGTVAASCLPQHCSTAVGGSQGTSMWGDTSQGVGVLPAGANVPLASALPVPGVLPALPACTRGLWLGMNVAKQGGSAPARSRRSEQHTWPCALS